MFLSGDIDICQSISIRARVLSIPQLKKYKLFKEIWLSHVVQKQMNKKISITIKLVCMCKKTRVDNSNAILLFSLSVPSLYFQGYHCFIKHGMNANEMPNIVYNNFNYTTLILKYTNLFISKHCSNVYCNSSPLRLFSSNFV